MDVQQMLDEYAVRRVREVWAFSRDHGEWETMRACFHPDATVRVLWYSGPADEFLERTIKSHREYGPGESSKHWFGNARAWLKGDRALCETDAQVLGRTNFAGHMFDFTLFIRLYDRMERRQGEWRGRKSSYWVMPYENRFIWGATAGMLLNLYRLCTADDSATINEIAGARP